MTRGGILGEKRPGLNDRFQRRKADVDRGAIWPRQHVYGLLRALFQIRDSVSLAPARGGQLSH
jgi:hypothetical protein